MALKGLGLEEMMKATSTSKALVIRINLIFILFFIVFYITLLLLQPSSLYHDIAGNAAHIGCSFRDCGGHHSKKVIENKDVIRGEKPLFLNGPRIGLVNMDPGEAAGWGEVVPVRFERVSKNLEWKDLFPEWIDEEEENEGPPTCPEVPMPEMRGYEGEMDVVVARVPCEATRDVFRLQVHLVVARVVVEKGKRRGGKVRVGLWSRCRPMMEVFRSDDLVGREGDWWVYEAEVGRLEEKLRLPVGSCKLALPLWGEGTNEAFDATKLSPPLARARREAYATVLHSSDAYVCGAIALAQSIRATKSSRDLVLLLDKSIPGPKRQALAKAGWKLVDIERIRNPRAEKYSYNEYNYSKLRLWQLLGYDKVVFVDADIVVLRNLDVLFSFPQLSATGNDGSIFNSGIMVIEPSNRTFAALMTRTVDIVSYNGGDQGFLNEVFVWWHRLPRRVNFLKNFWANTTAEASIKNRLFGADPPELYAIHYLGLKPWLCYRDYDCNWNIGDQRVYASDVAHRRWWTVHDKMEKELQGFCGLTERRMKQLDRDRKMAMQLGLEDGHWRINVTDPRRLSA
ncbi:UDP-glucuronate:xylan alpha-glucuronosyltransferase 2 [Acorus calamus]|uniref:Hexosyltransferase n=1 Tax=Acorus calamus TaxID=4465 RepID=A0AAV9EJB1_ACOCL|nr:UDP-glucuronate:xylan alpha-glucuronosyltransferase 2 [Acorus calamus]